MREYIVYAGSEFTIEWYYTEKGNSKALDYYNDLSTKEQIKFVDLVTVMGDHGCIRNTTKFNNEGDKIYAFKPQPDR